MASVLYRDVQFESAVLVRVRDLTNMLAAQNAQVMQAMVLLIWRVLNALKQGNNPEMEDLEAHQVVFISHLTPIIRGMNDQQVKVFEGLLQELEAGGVVRAAELTEELEQLLSPEDRSGITRQNLPAVNGPDDLWGDDWTLEGARLPDDSPETPATPPLDPPVDPPVVPLESVIPPTPFTPPTPTEAVIPSPTPAPSTPSPEPETPIPLPPTTPPEPDDEPDDYPYDEPLKDNTYKIVVGMVMLGTIIGAWIAFFPL